MLTWISQNFVFIAYANQKLWRKNFWGVGSTPPPPLGNRSVKPVLDTSPTMMHWVMLRIESHHDPLECHVRFMFLSCNLCVLSRHISPECIWSIIVSTLGRGGPITHVFPPLLLVALIVMFSRSFWLCKWKKTDAGEKRTWWWSQDVNSYIKFLHSLRSGNFHHAFEN